MTKVSILSILLISALSPLSGQAQRLFPEVIYGDDNRIESMLHPNESLRVMAKSVAGRVKRTELTEDPSNPDFFNFNKITLAESKQHVCEDERFSDQVILPDCSGFLAAPDILVTAGHCVPTDFHCANYRWVFDYYEGIDQIAKKDVFKCTEVIDSRWTSSFYSKKDYAVIKLDRVATGRNPLETRRKGRPLVGTDLVVIGHPSGLPLKTSDGGEVKILNKEEILYPLFEPIGIKWRIPMFIRSMIRKRNYFVANLDTFSGNSGAPVINKKSGQVEGILIEGATDYLFDEENSCNRANEISNSGWKSEERVFRITKIKALKKLLKK